MFRLPTSVDAIPENLDINCCFSRFRLNLKTGEWSEIAPLSVARYSAESVVISDKILVMGGTDENGNALNSVEYYDPELNKWYAAAPMLTPRFHLSTGVANGFVYVMGGYAKSDWGPGLETIDRYSMEDNTWTRVSTHSDTGGKKLSFPSDFPNPAHLYHQFRHLINQGFFEFSDGIYSRHDGIGRHTIVSSANR